MYGITSNLFIITTIYNRSFFSQMVSTHVLYSAKVAAGLLPAVCVCAHAHTYCRRCPEDNMLQLKDEPDPHCTWTLGDMITITMWVSSQKCLPQKTCTLIQPQSIGLGAAITQQAPAAQADQLAMHATSLPKKRGSKSKPRNGLHLGTSLFTQRPRAAQRKTNWGGGGWPAGSPLALIPRPQLY